MVSPKLSVVVCSLNGAAGVERCLCALAKQTIRSTLELIVVDDGSTDDTSDVGRTHGAIVIRHATNLGLAAARNSGVIAATAPVVAFLDDDCEPDPEWAEQLLTGYEKGVIGVGGPILPTARDGFMLGYLNRHNPLKAQESNLAISNRLAYRFKLYIQRQWRRTEEVSCREVYSFAGANMSFLRRALIEIGPFDERFRFGGEDQDLCMRLMRAFPADRLMLVPTARVAHHFKPSIRDTLRRSRAYGRGSARLYRKWPSVPPTLFPGPIVVPALLLLSMRRVSLAVTAVAVPHVIYPQGLRHAIANRTVMSLLDAYMQLAQEACGNIGFLEGLWTFRHFVPEAADKTIQAVEFRENIATGVTAAHRTLWPLIWYLGGVPSVISIVIISKDEAGLDETLADMIQQANGLEGTSETVVVDASEGRLDHILRRHGSAVRWVHFEQPPGVRTSIPHQRNAGVRAARGGIIVFTDAGCRPEPGWLAHLVAPLLIDEHITAGLTLATPGSTGLYDQGARRTLESRYLGECSTINLAFRREVFDAMGGFDQGFTYGSDVDFSWRLRDAGYRIRGVPDAVIRHDWGDWRRQMRRSYQYGRARTRLYRKHPTRLRNVLRDDPMVVAYPAFLLGLPLTLLFPLYPALLLIPAWRNRSNGVARVLVDHLTYGVGILMELIRP